MSVGMMTDDDGLLERNSRPPSSSELHAGEYISVGDTDAEFEIDPDVLDDMRRREDALRTAREEERLREQKAQHAAQPSGHVLAHEQLHRHTSVESQGNISDEEISVARLDRGLSTLSTTSVDSTASALDGSAAGWVVVVDVNIRPHRPSSPLPFSSSSAAPSAPSSSTSLLSPPFDPPLVDVRFHIFRRFVPHLAQPSPHIARVAERQQAYIREMEDEDGYSSDTSSDGDDDDAHEATGQPFPLTGNREIDAATLRRLIGMADDDSGDSDDDRPRAPRSTRTTMHDEDDDGDDEDAGPAGPLRTKNELPTAALPPVAPFSVGATDAIAWCGNVIALVDGMVVVQCQPGGRALDIGSAICLEDRTPLGRVEEVLGPVTEPLYSIRPLPDFHAEKPSEGVRMFSVSSQSSYVLPDTTPGTDASNPYDEELEAELQEFSDDEKEAEAKQRRKGRDKHAGAARSHAAGNGQGEGGLPAARPFPASPRNQRSHNRPAPPPAPQQQSPRSSAASAASSFYGQPYPAPFPYGYPGYPPHPAYAQHAWAPQQQPLPGAPPAGAPYASYTPLQRPYFPPPVAYGPAPPPAPPSYFSNY